MLLRIIGELQWFFTKRNEERHLLTLIRMRTSMLFAGTFIVFVISLLIYARQWIVETPTAGLVVATCAGGLGATFSMLTGLSTFGHYRLKDLQLVHRFNYLLIRSFSGVCAAVVLYFFIQAQLLSGGAFPELPVTLVEGAHISTTYNNVSVMILWCFIAGFSEKLVPGLMNRAAKQLSAPAT